LTRIHAREIEQIGRKLPEPLDLSLHRLDEPAPRLVIQLLVGEKLEKTSDREQRGPELVRGIRDELLACVVELRELYAHAVERARKLPYLVPPVVDDRCAEVATCDALGSRFQSEETVSEHAGSREPEYECEDECERGRQEQSLAHDLHGRERVGESSLEEEDGLGTNRDRNLCVVPRSYLDATPLGLARQHRGARDGISLHVAGAQGAGVGDHDERRLRLREDAESDDAGVRLDSEALDPILPAERVLREFARQRRPKLRELLQSGVPEPPLERRHHDHVRGPESAGDDADEDEDDAGPDSTRQRHAGYSVRKRYPAPRIVRISSGVLGSLSIFSRRCRTCTSIVRGSR